MERFAQLAAQALNRVLDTPIEAKDLETPPDPKLGDFGFPCFRLAKQFRKGPPQVAAELVSKLQALGALPGGLEVVQAGPYVNFRVPSKTTLQALLGDILAGSGNGAYGRLPQDTRGTWVLEYSSPNIAKPFNVYHLRPTALGAALDRIGRFRGFKVISLNHLGDWGTQYGKLIVALEKYSALVPETPSIHDLVTVYVKFHQDLESDPTLEDQARDAFRRLEEGDENLKKIWQRCVDISMSYFLGMYDRLNVKFDHIWGESFYTPHIAPLVQALEKRGILVESEGARVVQVTNRDGKEIPPCIVQKKDGSSIYATRDLAAAIYRYEKFKFDRMTYIVGQEQKLHFEQVFGVLRGLGLDWEPRCEHVPFGLYRFKDAKMSTRKGNFVTLDEVIEMTVRHVEKLIRERAEKAAEKAAERPGEAPMKFTDAEIAQIAEAVGVGAVVFHDLHTDPVRDVEFDLDSIADFEGETGPYLQYAHTRCLSILRKAGETGQGDGKFDAAIVGLLTTDPELQLVKRLGQFPIQLERTLTHAKASQLAHYLIDVTQAFGLFYRECRVLGEKPELTRARLMLVEATRRVLAQGLTLLGIPLPARM